MVSPVRFVVVVAMIVDVLDDGARVLARAPATKTFAQCVCASVCVCVCVLCL